MANFWTLSVFIFNSLLLLSGAHAQEAHNKSIIIDVSQIVKDILRNDSIAKDTLEIILRDTFRMTNTSLMYYHTDISNTVLVELQGVLHAFRNAKKKLPGFQPRILFSISETRELDVKLNISVYINQYYADMLNLLLTHNSIVAGVSINAVSLNNHWYFHGESYYTPHLPINSIIVEIQNFMKASSKSETENIPKIGFEAHIDSYLNCTNRLYNEHSADFAILNIPLTRSEDLVESYGLLVNDIFQKGLLEIHKKKFDSKELYIKISLNSTTDRGTLKAFNHYKWNWYKTYYQYQDNWLESVKDRLHNLEGIYSRRYENLLTTYLQQWKIDNKQGSQIILTYLHGYPYFNQSELVWNSGRNTEIIPYITNLPIHQAAEQHSSTEKSLSVEATGIFLKAVESADIKTVMISDKDWDILGNKIYTENFPYCKSTTACGSMNVIYLIDRDERLFSILNDDKFVSQVDGLNINTIVFSNRLGDATVQDWGKVAETFKEQNIVNATYACQIWTDVFDSYGGTVDCENTNACKAIDFRRAFKSRCEPNQNLTNTVIWMIELPFHKLETKLYDLDVFIKKIMKRMDSFVIGREAILKEFPDKNIVLQFKGRYNGDYSWTGSRTMYYNPYAERIGQFYEAILIWARIHDFPVILEPAMQSEFRFDNPLAWKQLEVDPLHNLHQVMTAVPLFIRRSYSKSKVFGNWTTGIYPSISKANIYTAKTIRIDFENEYSGVTLNLRLHHDQRSLEPEEMTTLLLFALKMFSNVEILLTQSEELTVLKEILPQLKENLEMNQIDGRTVYLGFSKPCSETNVESLNQITTGFKDAGLQVNVHVPTTECLNNLNTFGNGLGLEVENCSVVAESLVLSQETREMESMVQFAGISYIVCQTNTKLADNRNEKEMQDYLDSHLYLKKLLQYFYPNLKRIHFRLQPKLTESTTEEQLAKLMMFLTDVNNYAKGYNIHYFMLPAFAIEHNSKMEASFWKTSNYINLANLAVHTENLAEFRNDDTWVPKFAPLKNAKQEESTDIVEISESTNSSLEGENNFEPPFNKTNLAPQVTEGNTASQGGNPDKDFKMQLFTMAGLVLLLVIVVILAVILWRRKCRRLSKQEIHQFRKGHQVTMKKAVDERRQNQYTVSLFDGLVFQKDYEISKKELILNKTTVLGKGQISTVYLSKMINTEKRVAVKIVNKSCSSEALKGMLSEVKLLCYIGEHKNVVKFLGCYTKEIRKGVIWIITEFCEGGSLHAFLRKNRKNNSIHDKDMIKFSLEIASGMEYIAKQKIIHGDLCTANVLLNGNICKIYGCGGLARKMGEQQKYMKIKYNKEPRNWQWMAHESMKCMAYSIKSDVWSFGVTVWEIFNLGDIPFSEIEWNAEFVDSFEKGLRLQMPRLVSMEMETFEVMMKCWSIELNIRPDFSELVHHFSNLLGKQH